jgi:hypothetical protein
MFIPFALKFPSHHALLCMADSNSYLNTLDTPLATMLQQSLSCFLMTPFLWQAV